MNNPIYRSVFKTEFQNLVDIKKALGFTYDTQAAAFLRLDTFFREIPLTEKEVTKEICDNWCRKRSYETCTNQSHRISSMRVFCNYLNDINITAYIPPKGLSKKRIKYDSHIYTEDELKRFFAVVDKSQSIPSECPYRGQVMPLFFRILYTSGMRVSELRLLKIKDVDFDAGSLTIRNAKNHKDRAIPIHKTLLERCRKLKECIHIQSSEDEYFFMLRRGQAMPLVNVYKNFRRYLLKAEIPHTGRGPRVHDFRCTYCVNLLRKWVEEEKDLMEYLPYMRTMLGHEGFEETAYYLKLTAEMYPYITEKLQTSFPDLIKEAVFEEGEFY